jgi:hypothetical protein
LEGELLLSTSKYLMHLTTCVGAVYQFDLQRYRDKHNYNVKLVFTQDQSTSMFHHVYAVTWKVELITLISQTQYNSTPKYIPP